MPKKQKQKQPKKIEEIANDLTQKCQVSEKPAAKTIPTGNSILADQIDPQLLAKWPKLKIKVPPVFIHKPVDFTQHVKKIVNQGIKIYQPLLGKNYTKVVCETFNDHKYLVQYLDKKQLPYHTFGNPSKRKMKVVIRGLPNDTDLNAIKAELKSLSIPVIRVHQMQIGVERHDKTMLLLAVVPHDDDGKTILRLTQLLGHKVRLEPPNDKPRQCFRCQKWGHSQRYCHGVIKCVKCGGTHLTKKCEKRPEVEPKCANCSDTHTASCRQCLFAPGSEGYQMMQELRFRTPCYKPRILVTSENYETLYRNVDYNERA